MMEAEARDEEVSARSCCQVQVVYEADCGCQGNQQNASGIHKQQAVRDSHRLSNMMRLQFAQLVVRYRHIIG